MMRESRFVRTYGKISVPAMGCFWGADDTTRGFWGPTGIETQLRRTMAIRNRHAGWGVLATVSTQIGIQMTAKQDVAASTIPMLSLGAQGWPTDGLSQIADGKWDAQLGTLFAGMETIGSGWIFRPMMEMNGAHNAAYYGDPVLYREAWSRISTVMRAESPSGVLVFCPQQVSSSGTDPGAWLAYEPDDYDWGGLDLYRATFDVAVPFIEHYREGGRPTVICESGFQQGKIVLGPDNTTYDKDGSVTGNSLILHTRDQVKQHPNVIGYLVWNNLGPIGDDFVDSSPKSLTEYRVFAQDPYFAVR